MVYANVAKVNECNILRTAKGTTCKRIVMTKAARKSAKSSHNMDMIGDDFAWNRCSFLCEFGMWPFSRLSFKEPLFSSDQ